MEIQNRTLAAKSKVVSAHVGKRAPTGGGRRAAHKRLIGFVETGDLQRGFAREMAAGFDRVFVKAFHWSSSARIFVDEGDEMLFDRSLAARVASSSVPAGIVDSWFEVSQFPLKKDALNALSLHASTLSRSQADRPLDPVVTERMLRQSELLVRAAEVFGEQGSIWMTKPHPLLDDKSPAAYASNEFAAERVRSVLNAIKHGGVV